MDSSGIPVVIIGLGAALVITVFCLILFCCSNKFSLRSKPYVRGSHPQNPRHHQIPRQPPQHRNSVTPYPRIIQTDSNGVNFEVVVSNPAIPAPVTRNSVQVDRRRTERLTGRPSSNNNETCHPRVSILQSGPNRGMILPVREYLWLTRASVESNLPGRLGLDRLTVVPMDLPVAQPVSANVNLTLRDPDAPPTYEEAIRQSPRVHNNIESITVHDS